MKDITGKKYGDLTVIKKSHKNKENRWIWICKCSCGNIRKYPKNALDYGRNHCGCKNTYGRTHGMRYSKEYRAWTAIKQRCHNILNKDYCRYGFKGIRVSKKWRESFSNFFNDMGNAPSIKHQIERINTLKGYNKNNCIWATSKQNLCNRTTSRIWDIKGKLFFSAMDAAKYFNVSDATIHRWCKGGGRTIKKVDCNCYWRYDNENN